MPPSTSESLDWFTLGMGLFGGLALFLYGLDQLSNGLKGAAGDTLKALLTRLTTNRFLGALTGAVITGILNSSSVTTVLVVGFVTAGVMSLGQSVSVIMGANICSTVTAQLLAFNLSAYALLPIAIGFFMLFASKRAAVRYWGMIVMGLGLVFYGMGVMSDAMRPLRSHEPFVQALAKMENPLLGILGGALFTGLVQSSAATVGLAIALASEGLLTLPAGIALALGANIGTCVTALLAALGKPVEAVRAAVVHVGFNVLGVLVWLPFVGTLARLAIGISPAEHHLDASARLAAEVPRQIANANTLFNVINTCLFIGLAGWFARMATKLVPAREKKEALSAPMFLDQAALSVPAVALEQVREELGRLGDMIRAMLVEFPAKEGAVTTQMLSEISQRGTQVEALEDAILQFLGRIRQEDLSEAQSQTLMALMSAAIGLRNIADIIAGDLVSVARAAASGQLQASALRRTVLSECYQSAQQALELAVHAVRQPNEQRQTEIENISDQVKALAEKLMSQVAAGLDTSDPNSLSAVRLQTTFVDGLRQISTLAKGIAESLLNPMKIESFDEKTGDNPNQ
ncbi:MAG: Na/Pi cotransporter family protein [Chthoniobacterales bacterium]